MPQDVIAIAKTLLERRKVSFAEEANALKFTLEHDDCPFECSVAVTPSGIVLCRAIWNEVAPESLRERMGDLANRLTMRCEVGCVVFDPISRRLGYRIGMPSHVSFDEGNTDSLIGSTVRFAHQMLEFFDGVVAGGRPESVVREVVRIHQELDELDELDDDIN